MYYVEVHGRMNFLSATASKSCRTRKRRQSRARIQRRRECSGCLRALDQDRIFSYFPRICDKLATNADLLSGGEWQMECHRPRPLRQREAADAGRTV